MTKTLLIVNPKASGVRPDAVAEVTKLLGAATELEVVATRERNHATEIVRALPPGTEQVFAMGGDGLFNEVANGIDADMPVGLLGAGASNVLPRALGLPGDAKSAALRLATSSATRQISLGVANGRRFTFCCGLGIDAEVVREVDRRGRRKGRRASDSAVAWELVRQARGDGQKAFAWGYMTHLAADILSHNHFVPIHTLISFRARTSGHAYWEARMDGLQQIRYWRRARQVLEFTYEDCDELVEQTIEHTLLSFKANKKIFDSLMGISKLEQWQLLVNTVNRSSRYSLSRTTMDRYNHACVHAVMDLLVHKKRSFTQELDATGSEMLKQSIRLRRQLRKLRRSRSLDREAEERIMQRLINRAPRIPVEMD